MLYYVDIICWPEINLCSFFVLSGTGTAAQIGNFCQWCMGRILPLENSSAYGAIVPRQKIADFTSELKEMYIQCYYHQKYSILFKDNHV